MKAVLDTNAVIYLQKGVLAEPFPRGHYFQISPRAYYGDEELASLFSNLSNKCKGVISVVEK